MGCVLGSNGTARLAFRNNGSTTLHYQWQIEPMSPVAPVSSSSSSSSPSSSPFLCSHLTGVLLPGESGTAVFTFSPIQPGLFLQSLRFITTPPLRPLPTAVTPSITDGKRGGDDAAPVNSKNDDNDGIPRILLRGICVEHDEGAVSRANVESQLERFSNFFIYFVFFVFVFLCLLIVLS